VSYDLQCSVEEFLSDIDGFGEGMNLIYSRQPMPDTLQLSMFANSPHRRKILIQNGARLTFFLPHRYERAGLEIFFEEDVTAILERLRNVPV
jgi:hypothetical protein